MGGTELQCPLSWAVTSHRPGAGPRGHSQGKCPFLQREEEFKVEAVARNPGELMSETLFLLLKASIVITVQTEGLDNYYVVLWV